MLEHAIVRIRLLASWISVVTQISRTLGFFYVRTWSSASVRDIFVAIVACLSLASLLWGINLAGSLISTLNYLHLDFSLLLQSLASFGLPFFAFGSTWMTSSALALDVIAGPALWSRSVSCSSVNLLALDFLHLRALVFLRSHLWSESVSLVFGIGWIDFSAAALDLSHSARHFLFKAFLAWVCCCLHLIIYT